MVSFEKYLSFLSTTNKFVVEVIVEVLYNIEDNTSFFADSISFCSSLTWIDDDGGIYIMLSVDICSLFSHDDISIDSELWTSFTLLQ